MQTSHFPTSHVGPNPVSITHLQPVAMVRGSNRARREDRINKACAKLGLKGPVRYIFEDKIRHVTSGHRNNLAQPIEKFLYDARAGHIASASCILIIDSMDRLSQANIEAAHEGVCELLRAAVFVYFIECDLLMVPEDKDNCIKRITLLLELARAAEKAKRMSAAAKLGWAAGKSRNGVCA